MHTEADVLAYVVAALEYLDIPYVIGGGWALGVWTQPRLTHDVDFVVDLPVEQVPAFCAELSPEDFYLDCAAMQEQFRHPASPSAGMYSFYHHDSGLKIDFFPLRRDDPPEVAAFARRREVEILPGQQASVLSAQDLLVAKLRWWERGGRQSETQKADCLNLVLTDLARTAHQIDWREVDELTQARGPRVYDAWQAVQAAARSVLEPEM